MGSDEMSSDENGYVRDSVYRWQTIDLDQPQPDQKEPPRRTPAPDLARVLEVGRKELVEQLSDDPSESFRVAELGVGDAYLAMSILENHSKATALLVDSPPAILDRAAQRLAAHKDRYQYLSWHPDRAGWPAELDGPLDAVASFLAVHHLPNDQKQRLTAEVFTRLRPGGIFADFDLFRNPGSVFDESVPQQLHDATCATLGEMSQFLYEAGFVDVRVTANAVRGGHQGQMALIVGTKP